MNDAKTMTCDCGNDTYHVRFNTHEHWVECTECGRPSATIGDGWEKQREWEARKNDC